MPISSVCAVKPAFDGRPAAERVGGNGRICFVYKPSTRSPPRILGVRCQAWQGRGNPDCWTVLGIPAGSDVRTIKAARRQKAPSIHPDIDPKSEAEMVALNLAYEEAIQIIEGGSNARTSWRCISREEFLEQMKGVDAYNATRNGPRRDYRSTPNPQPEAESDDDCDCNYHPDRPE
eukprot:jgi/Botrbrau1/16689/Bobra.0267s0005.1